METKCDICGKTICKTDGKGYPIKYWNGSLGVIENNRKVLRSSFNICSAECCQKFIENSDSFLKNPFQEYYIEIMPVKVLGER